MKKTNNKVRPRAWVLVAIAIIFGIYLLALFNGFRNLAPQPVVESVTTEVIIGQPTVPGVVSNDDGAVTVRGSASFTSAPISNNKPPVMVPEAEAKKLSSPPTK